LAPTIEENENERMEKTQVLYGVDEIIKFIVPLFALIRKRLDICVDYSTPSIQFETKPVWKAYQETDERGIKIRYLTEIRKENIYYCKELMKLKHLELRHLDGVTLNFGMADESDIAMHLSDKEGEAVTSLLYTTSKQLVKAQQYLFETLWNKASAAEEQIKDIEDEMRPHLTQTFDDICSMQKKAWSMLNSAKEEILGIFSPNNTDSNLLLGLKEEHVEDNKEKQEQLIQLLKQALMHGLRIRIIAPDNNSIIKELKQRISRGNSSQQNKIEIQIYQPQLQFKVPTMLVIDQKESLLLELVDDVKPNEPSMARRATYSNNEYTISSYISIFETL
jgi:hypothetical protein